MNGQGQLAPQRGHPHDGWRGYIVTIDGQRKEFGTPGGVIAELGRRLVDLNGKLEIEVQRQEPE